MERAKPFKIKLDNYFEVVPVAPPFLKPIRTVPAMTARIHKTQTRHGIKTTGVELRKGKVADGRSGCFTLRTVVTVFG